ncbi:hypothetical protein S40285_08474 [Stachybotrys chlorohalonatus IBT 40285]|uniref:Glucose-methanol-choline oxidoreductase N-terminal domain-containing protein n=1 Tax=Stachybotrys chlorohalonatus (strain IBT 40285) TaxID=1283841 RepID=A0A084QZI7_STAC4|nr:hypothetical protein S40285_08474 [Stachybotrys chlorohalonata IBT 40285]
MWPFLSYPLARIQQIDGHEYDYIIVGGGTAGCVVASRLSEDPTVSVLLVEKGSVDDRWFTRVPLASCANGTYMVRRPTQSGPAAGNHQSQVFAAEAMGGTSRLNAMIYTRGVPAYYDQWAHSGHQSWSWNSVEPHFRKIEHRGAEWPDIETARASPGKVQLRQHKPSSGAFTYLQKAAEAVGLRTEASTNHPTSYAMGYFNLDLTIDSNGQRHSAERAYLPYEVANERRRSLHICTLATVVKLDIPVDSERATGLILQGDPSCMNRHVRVKARREIVLCAGAVCTPQILQLSGLGPSSLLQKHGIPLRQDLPGVGAHLLDHSGFPVWIDVAPQDTFYHMMKSPYQALKQFILYCFFRSGWLKSSFDRAIFFNTAHIDPGKMTVSQADDALDSYRAHNIPNVEIMLLPGNSKPDIYSGHSSITLQTILNQPVSSGTVEIKSTDPATDPDICLGLITEQRDRLVARKALQFALHLAERFVNDSGYPHASSILDGPGSGGAYPGWNNVSKEELDNYIDKYIEPGHHLTSSCRMAKRANGGVVDDELRVYGLSNVRIADASVLPNITPAHPMASIYMIGERCADFIRKTWQQV